MAYQDLLGNPGKFTGKSPGSLPGNPRIK